MTRAALLALLGSIGIVPRAGAQPSGEAWLTLARAYQTSPVGDGTLGGLTVGLGIGSPTLTFGPEMVIRNGDSLRVRGFALGARLRQRSQLLQPHLVVTVGAYAWQRSVPVTGPVADPGARRWEEVNYVSASLGGGVTIGTWRGRWSGLVEGRWHRNLSHDPAEGSRSMVGIDAGLRVAW
ncbi:MAG: hypothetical protein ACKVZ0_22620 [Gemmatimonadales bacterium]